MTRSITALIFTFLTLTVATHELQAQPACVEANGLLWCFNDQECGQACEEVCEALGIPLVVDDDVWFQAQNTEEECQAISEAFGLGDTVEFSSFTFACLEDKDGPHSVGGGLVAPLFCSSFSGCPANHRTGMDQEGVPCGPGSRHSICPCGPRLVVQNPIPTLSEWGFMVMAGILGIAALLVLRRRRITV